MRIIRLIIISILLLSIIITIISLFIPSHVRIAKTIQINSTQQAVMEQIANPANWPNWYPATDSSNVYYQNGTIRGLALNTPKHEYLFITGKYKDEVTATYLWPGREIRTGWQIVPATDRTSVTVQWYMEFHLRWYPWEKFTSFMFERVYNPQLQEGLEKLKDFVEKH